MLTLYPAVVLDTCVSSDETRLSSLILVLFIRQAPVPCAVVFLRVNVRTTGFHFSLWSAPVLTLCPLDGSEMTSLKLLYFFLALGKVKLLVQFLKDYFDESFYIIVVTL